MVYKLVEGTRYRMAEDKGLESEQSGGELLEGWSDRRRRESSGGTLAEGERDKSGRRAAVGHLLRTNWTRVATCQAVRWVNPGVCGDGVYRSGLVRPGG
jgi:hypothetical protein